MTAPASQGDRRPAHGHWARMEERGVYLGLWIMLTAYRLVGRRGVALLLYPVILYYFLAGAAARNASRDFLTRVQVDPAGRMALGGKVTWRHSFRHFLCFGEAILDKVAAWIGGIGLEDVDFENHAVFDRLQSSGRGGVLIASHLGNVEVCRALGRRARGLRISVLVHTKHSANFSRLMNDLGPDTSISLLQVTEVGPETAILLRERVTKGEFVVIVGDRTPPHRTSRVSWVPFLGRPAPFPQGPFLLAAMLKCPVLLIFCVKRRGRHLMVFEPFLDAPYLPRRNRSALLDEWIARYAARLEHFCLRYPLQWFNFFDFWTQAAGMPHPLARPDQPIGRIEGLSS